MKYYAFTILLNLSIAFSVIAQKPTPTLTNSEKDENDVVRVSTSLVQLDAVITDKKGNLVTDLQRQILKYCKSGKMRQMPLSSEMICQAVIIFSR